MKFPSLHLLRNEAYAAAFRFPMSLLCSVLATMLAVYMVELEI